MPNFGEVLVLTTIILSSFSVIPSFNVDRGELWLLFSDYTFHHNSIDSINVKLGSKSYATAAAAAAAAALHIA